MKHLKITSVMLSAVMCMSMFATPVSVFADETPDTTETQTEATQEQGTEATQKPAPKETEKEEPEETKEPEATEAREETEETAPEAAEEKEPAETEKTEEPGESETQEPVESQKPAAVIEDKREAANKIVLSGVNGTVAYEMDDKGTLTIKGSGEIPKHLLDNMAYEHEVKSIAFSGNQLTGLADECFYNFAKLKSIKIPGNITSIGMHAFRYCEELQALQTLSYQRMPPLKHMVCLPAVRA